MPKKSMIWYRRKKDGTLVVEGFAPTWDEAYKMLAEFLNSRKWNEKKI